MPLFTIVVKNTSFPPKDADIPAMFEHAFDMFNASVVHSLTPSVVAAYPPAQPNVTTSWERGADVLTHAFFTCSARRTARALSAFVPVFYYQWSYNFSNWIEYSLLFGEPHSLGNYHCEDNILHSPISFSPPPHHTAKGAFHSISVLLRAEQGWYNLSNNP